MPLREGAPLKDMERVTVGEGVLVGCALTEMDPVLALERVPAPPKLPVEDRHKDTVGELDRVEEVEKLKLGVPLSTELADLDREGDPEALGQWVEVVVTEEEREVLALGEPPTPPFPVVEDPQGDTLRDWEGEVVWEALAVILMDPVPVTVDDRVRVGVGGGRVRVELAEGEEETEKVTDTLGLLDSVVVAEAHLENAGEGLKLELEHPVRVALGEREGVVLKHRVREEVGLRLGEVVCLGLFDAVMHTVLLLDLEGEGV